MRPLLWLLILSTSATLQAQIFKGVNYLYRATEKAKARHVYGVLTVDSANKKLTFTSDLKVKGKLLKFDITADAITGANYERESAPPAVAGRGTGRQPSGCCSGWSPTGPWRRRPSWPRRSG